MKIYPSKHNIVQTPKIDLLMDVPLAYVDTDSKEYTCSITSKLNHDEIKPIVPYQEFDSYNISLFKPINKGLTEKSSDFIKVNNSDIIQRIGNTYQYIPTNTTTFIPQEFSYSIIVKKQIEYNTQTTYNIKMACIDDTTKSNDKILSKKILKVIGDAPQRGICPINVWVNNKDMSSNSLINSQIMDNDFVFIQSKDGKTRKGFDDATYEIIDVPIEFEKDFLSHHSNVWVSVDEFPIEIENKEVVLKSPKLFTDVSITNSAFLNLNNNESLFKIETEDKEKVSFHYLFNGTHTAAIIKEYENKGFIIYTPTSFFDNIEINAKLFYEILMFVYSHTYLESEVVKQWITDTPPDYVIINNKLNTIEKFISTKQIHRFFDLPQKEVAFSYIHISKKNIIMNGIVNDYITFKKLSDGPEFSKYADPPKSNDSMISVYTPQKQIMYFDEFIYEIQDNIEDFIKWKRVDNHFVFNLRTFKHTYANINISKDPFNDIIIPLTITANYQEIPIDNSSFYIYVKDNILNYCLINKFQESLGTVVAQIDITKENNEINLYDMRRRGGGLPNDIKSNQELLDIGHIKGLAYRKAGAIIITLPKRLEQHKELIENVVRKHMVAEKFPVIIFEEDSEA